MASILKMTARLLDSGLHSDVTLLCESELLRKRNLNPATGEQIPAHKAILAARSPVFEAMFAHKMRESLDGKVEIEGVHPAVLRQILRSVDECS